jgi:DNA helicase TIP49 (TBP-interacting protein)
MDRVLVGTLWCLAGKPEKVPVREKQRVLVLPGEIHKSNTIFKSVTLHLLKNHASRPASSIPHHGKTRRIPV